MLVLGRKVGERVLLGEDIEVIVLEVGRNQVKLGFTAPRYVPICRAEIHHRPADGLPFLPAAPCEEAAPDNARRVTEAVS